MFALSLNICYLHKGQLCARSLSRKGEFMLSECIVLVGTFVKEQDLKEAPDTDILTITDSRVQLIRQLQYTYAKSTARFNVRVS